MFGLGLRLSVRGGREALIRLALTTAAVAVGVAVLLAVLADYHAFEHASTRPSWESTTAAAPGRPAAGAELWNYSENIYAGRFVEQLDVAALGPQAPIVPGLPRLPERGQFYASPALAALLRSTPRDQLGDRFPGSLVGLIGDTALSGPSELAVVVGHSADQLAALPGTIQVDTITTAPQSQGTTNLYRLAFGIGAIALLFPLLILINTATRLAAARREERYAAMRLVGATPRQVNVLASVDAVLSALSGTVLGIGVFLLIRPALARIGLSGAQFFADTVTPTVWGYAGMLVAVPLAAAAGSLASLRRVQTTPLGVARRITPPPPTVWRVLPLLVGIPVFIYPLVHNPADPAPVPVFLGLVLIMLGLVLGGSWLTMQAALLLARTARGAPSLLAARRLADNPKAAFRAVSGLVLAVFVGTLIAGIAPADIAAQSGGRYAALTGVLRVPFTEPLSTTQADRLLADLRRQPGVALIPIYADPNYAPSAARRRTPDTPDRQGPPKGPPPFTNVIGCASLRELDVLGTCPAGATAVEANVDDLTGDNPLLINRALPIVGASSAPVSVDPSRLSMQMLLVRTPDASTLERVRTLLTSVHTTVSDGPITLTAWQQGSVEPETFGEVAEIRNNDARNIERVILAAVALTILVAGCSLAVTAGGSVVERKRPFTLLRLAGTPVSTLYRVVIAESMIPLLAASVIAAAVGLGISVPVVKAVLPAGAHDAHPGHLYYLIVAAGLLGSLLLISASLPLLARLSAPRNARFE
jgi:ABC-type antimicrobial peptide transport system permease subunit